MIYLDNASTTKPCEKAVDIITSMMKETWFNPSGNCYGSRKVKQILEQDRKDMIEMLGGDEDDYLVFTSSGSEANNLAIKGFLEKNPKYDLVFDSLSHSSVMKMDCLSNKRNIDCNPRGLICESSLVDIIDYIKNVSFKRPLVFITGGNNEIGTVQNIKKIASITHRNKGVLIVDCVQLFADRKINVKELGIDMCVISGHKIGVPCGVGALYIKKGIDISPLINGSQENGLRGGTEAHILIHAFVECAKDLQNSYENRNKKIRKIRDYFVRECVKRFDAELIGTSGENKFRNIGYNRLENNASLLFKGYDARDIQMYLDNYDIYCSVGSACNSFEYKPSKVLTAIGLNDPDVYSVVRFSFSDENTKEEADEVLNVLGSFFESKSQEVKR